MISEIDFVLLKRRYCALKAIGLIFFSNIYNQIRIQRLRNISISISKIQSSQKKLVLEVANATKKSEKHWMKQGRKQAATSFYRVLLSGELLVLGILATTWIEFSMYFSKWKWFVSAGLKG